MSSTKEEIKIPDEFKKIVKDFLHDIKTTFPEFQPLIQKWWKEKSVFDYIENDEEREVAYLKAENSSILFLFKFIQKKYPPRFFDILYQNNEIFKEDSDVDTEFLPHIHFKNLWSFEITNKTRETIWKYLQLILFSIIGSVDNKESFGDTSKLFEAINEDDFKGKLEDTLNQMQNLFNMSSNPDVNGSESTTEGTSSESGSGINMDHLPNADDIHSHISGMLDGKLGKLAKEIAEETATDLDIDMENTTDVKDILSSLMKNPTKLMGLVKNVGDKLDSRIKSGDIKESELISEAADLMKRMKDMPGMDNIQSMLNKMGLGGKGAKMNMGAMEAQLNRNMKMAQTKERMKAKADTNRNAKQSSFTENANANEPALTDEQLISIFSTGEKVEKTPRGVKPEIAQENSTIGKNKKKKGKK